MQSVEAESATIFDFWGAVCGKNKAGADEEREEDIEGSGTVGISNSFHEQP